LEWKENCSFSVRHLDQVQIINKYTSIILLNNAAPVKTKVQQHQSAELFIITMSA